MSQHLVEKVTSDLRPPAQLSAVGKLNFTGPRVAIAEHLGQRDLLEEFLVRRWRWLLWMPRKSPAPGEEGGSADVILSGELGGGETAAIKRAEQLRALL